MPFAIAPYSASSVLHDTWWVAVVSLLVSLAATPMARYMAYRTGIVDRPDDLLKPHKRPIAYLGGLAICLGLLAGLAAYALTLSNGAELWQKIFNDLPAMRVSDLLANPMWNLLGIAAGSLTITLVGLWDDIRNIRPSQKIAGQVLAAGLLLAGGVGTQMANVILKVVAAGSPDWLVIPLSVIGCMVLVIAACNATNLLDGLDGLCGGVTAIIAIGFAALAVWLAMWGHAPGVDDVRVVLCLAMVGAVLGFLPYNIPPASIFMGDAGSMLLGFFAATMMAMFCRETAARWLLAAIVVFSLPILDTGLAVVRRLLSGKSIFAGDRSHLYDQLVDRGMTVKQVVGLFYALAALAAAIGVLCAIFLRLRQAMVLYLILFAAAWVAFHMLGMIRPPVHTSKQPQGQPPL